MLKNHGHTCHHDTRPFRVWWGLLSVLALFMVLHPSLAEDHPNTPLDMSATAAPKRTDAPIHIARVASIRNQVVAGTPENGTVRLQRLAVNQPLFNQQTIHTGPDSSVSIRFLDGSLFKLGAEATVHLSQFAFSPAASFMENTVEVVQGSYRYISGLPTSHSRMVLKTPMAVVGVRGTVLEGLVAEELPSFYSIPKGEGVLLHQGTAQRMGEGEFSAVEANKRVPAHPRDFPLEVAWQTLLHLDADIREHASQVPLSEEHMLEDARASQRGVEEQLGIALAPAPTPTTTQTQATPPGTDLQKGKQSVEKLLQPDNRDVWHWLRGIWQELWDGVTHWWRGVREWLQSTRIGNTSFELIRSARAAADRLLQSLSLLVGAARLELLSPPEQPPSPILLAQQKVFLAQAKRQYPQAMEQVKQRQDRIKRHNRENSASGARAIFKGVAKVAHNGRELAGAVGMAIQASPKGDKAMAEAIVAGAVGVAGRSDNATIAAAVVAAGAAADREVAGVVAAAAMGQLPDVARRDAAPWVAIAATHEAPSAAVEIAGAVTKIAGAASAAEICAGVIRTVNGDQAAAIAKATTEASGPWQASAIAMMATQVAGAAQAVAIARAVTEAAGGGVGGEIAAAILKVPGTDPVAVARGVTEIAGHQVAGEIAASVVKSAGPEVAARVAGALSSLAPDSAAAIATAVIGVAGSDVATGVAREVVRQAGTETAVVVAGTVVQVMGESAVVEMARALAGLAGSDRVAQLGGMLTRLSGSTPIADIVRALMAGAGAADRGVILAVIDQMTGWRKTAEVTQAAALATGEGMGALKEAMNEAVASGRVDGVIKTLGPLVNRIQNQVAQATQDIDKALASNRLVADYAGTMEAILVKISQATATVETITRATHQAVENNQMLQQNMSQQMLIQQNISELQHFFDSKPTASPVDVWSSEQHPASKGSSEHQGTTDATKRVEAARETVDKPIPPSNPGKQPTADTPSGAAPFTQLIFDAALKIIHLDEPQGTVVGNLSTNDFNAADTIHFSFPDGQRQMHGAFGIANGYQIIIRDSSALATLLSPNAPGPVSLTLTVEGMNHGGLGGVADIRLPPIVPLTLKPLPVSAPAEVAIIRQASRQLVSNMVAGLQNQGQWILDQDQLLLLTLGKMDQQLSPGGVLSQVQITDLIKKLGASITPNMITMVMEVGMVDAVRSVIPQSIMDRSDGMVVPLLNAAADGATTVRLRFKPIIDNTARTIAYDQAGSFVDLITEGSHAVPYTQWPLKEVIDLHYNANLPSLQARGLGLFTGRSADSRVSQPIPAVYSFDQFFPGLIGEIRVGLDGIVLKGAANASQHRTPPVLTP
ncbi:MAG: FecR domain-containing protein [Magnetococcales bacterium]|nr:FecR domain-containing protein [Magnetococcales bacterium]